MNKNLIYSLLFLVLASTPASSQDLNALRDRASQLWAVRLQLTKAREADLPALKSKQADFIEKEGRSDFPMYEIVREATVTALEFTGDKSRVLVTTKAKSLFPGVGIADQTITESWVWKGGNWFVHVEPAAVANPFNAAGAASGVGVHTVFAFQLVDKEIDLGAHKQGDKISGTVKFASARSALQNVRARGMDAFRIVATRWIDDKNGELEFVIDSSLISQDIDASIVLEAVGPERVFELSTVKEKLALVAKIEGKVRISQLPQTPAAQKDRFIELEVENVGKAPFRLEQIRSIDGNFSVADPMPPLLAPGQTAKVMIAYPQSRLVDGELIIQLSEGLLPSNNVLFRIKGPAVQSADQQPAAALDRAKMDAAVRAIQDAERARAPR